MPLAYQLVDLAALGELVLELLLLLVPVAVHAGVVLGVRVEHALVFQVNFLDIVPAVEQLSVRVLPALFEYLCIFPGFVCLAQVRRYL